MCSPPLCRYQERWWPAVLWGLLYLTRSPPLGPTHWWSPGRKAAGSTVPGCFHPTHLSTGRQTQAVGDRYPVRPGYKRIHIGKQTNATRVNKLWCWYPGSWTSQYETGSLCTAQQETDSAPWRVAWGWSHTYNLTQHTVLSMCMSTNISHLFI